MNRIVRLTMVALLVTGVTVLAQQGRPAGGMGGFGGGGPTNLIRSKTVRAELKVTDEQGTKLDSWAKDYQTKNMEAMKGKFAELKDLPREEMGKKMAEIQAEATKEAYKQLGEVLQADQVKRLKQIDVQVAGTRAFTRPDVQEALKLTDDQKEKLKDVGQAAMKEMTELREEYGLKGFGSKLDADKQKEFDKKSAAITAETFGKIKGMLTDDQKKSWEEMTGATVDVAKIQAESRPQFGPGGPGGQPRPKKNDN